MRLVSCFAILFIALPGGAGTPAGTLWNDLTIKRQKLPGAHQEFDASRVFKAVTGDQAAKWQLILDISQTQWREKRIDGSGNTIKLFDSKDLLKMDEGGDEF